jgi:hypothetical protein
MRASPTIAAKSKSPGAGIARGAEGIIDRTLNDGISIEFIDLTQV